MNLYSVSSEFEHLSRKIVEDEDGSFYSENMLQISKNKDELMNTLQNFSAIMLNLEHEEVAIDAAIARMENRKDLLRSKIKNMRNQLLMVMENCGVLSIKCPEFEIKLSKNPPKLCLDEGITVPDEYMHTIVSTKINKELIKEDLKQGVCIEGASLIQENRLVIK